MEVGDLSVVISHGRIPGPAFVGGQVGAKRFGQDARSVFLGWRPAPPGLGPEHVMKVRPEGAVHRERLLSEDQPRRVLRDQAERGKYDQYGREPLPHEAIRRGVYEVV